MPIQQMEAYYTPQYEGQGKTKGSGARFGIDKDSLIHPSFPKQDTIDPSYLGSKSQIPQKGYGDYAEDLPAGFGK